MSIVRQLIAGIGVLLPPAAFAGQSIVTSDTPSTEIQLGGRGLGVSRFLSEGSPTPGGAADRAAAGGKRQVRFSIGGGLAIRGAETRFSNDWSAGETKTRTASYTYGTDYNWVWTSSWENAYRSSSTPTGAAVSADLWFSDRLGLGVAWERFSQELASEAKFKFDLTATETYHGFYSNYTYTAQRTLDTSGTADDLTHRQSTFHFAVSWRQPLTDRVHLEVSGGPSVFRVEQQLTREVFQFYDCKETERSSRNRLTGCRIGDLRAVERGSSVGFNLGTSLAFQLQPRLELVVQGRYASGKVELDAMDTEWLVDGLKKSLPYNYTGTGERTKVRLETGSFLPRVFLRYTF